METLMWIVGVCSALLTIGTAVKFYYPPTRNVARHVESLLELAEAQLRKNGGGSLTDKVDALVATVSDIREAQMVRTKEMDARHEANVQRLDRLEEHSLATERRLERIEVRQEYGGRLLGLAVAVMPVDVQEGIRRIVEQNPPPEGAGE